MQEAGSGRERDREGELTEMMFDVVDGMVDGVL